MVLIIIYFISSNQSGKYQVEDMNVYIEPLINELVRLWNGICMYGISRPIQEISIPCNDCIDNTRCPRVNPFLWFVFLSSTLIAFNYMK